MHKAITCIAVALIASGCGSNVSQESGTYSSRVAHCLGSTGLDVSVAGNAMRVSSSSGAVANLHLFATPQDAERFYRQLEVPSAYGGRAVAVYLGPAAADHSMRRVVAGCLAP